MRRVIFVFFMIATISQSCKTAEKNPFWNEGVEFFEVQQIFDNERLPNVVTATDGTVIAVWGWNNVRVRRSEDGGKTWGPEISIGPGLNSGGTLVDETNGDILIFTEDTHPPAPLHMFRSKDHGITLTQGEYAGRLIRPSRVYAEGNDTEFWHLHYTNAIYSDDGGKTWNTSEPFPVYGTGEAAIGELSDGTLYYNSRRHKSTDGQSPRWRYTALSKDGGQTWENATISDVLPDGNQHSDYGLMAGLVRLPVDGRDILLFSNIDVPKKENEEDYAFEVRWRERIRGTVWASFDGGKTWPVKRLVDEGNFAYSSMAAGRKGTPSEGFIYLFYESNGGAKMARFNLAWITEGKDWKEFLKD